MNRRTFLRRSILTSGFTVIMPGGIAAAQQQNGSGGNGRLFLLLRHYTVTPGAPGQRFDAYFRDALIPAANRRGITPVGVFSAWFGPESLSGRYLLLPAPSADLLLDLDAELERDAAYAKASAEFLAGPSTQAPFTRVDAALMRTIDRLPGIRVPDRLARPNTRIFELRTYSQPTLAAHRRKVSMFEEGEAAVLASCGFNGVFHAVNLVGAGVAGASLPSLTYMWVYGNLQEREQAETAWGASKDREALFAQPRFADTPSTISNIILRPAPYSQL
jgi:hypothetical protein